MKKMMLLIIPMVLTCCNLKQNNKTDYALDSIYFYNEVEVIPLLDSLTMNVSIGFSPQTILEKKYYKRKGISPIDSLKFYREKFGDLYLNDSILYVQFDSTGSVNERIYSLTILHNRENGVEYFMHKSRD